MPRSAAGFFHSWLGRISSELQALDAESEMSKPGGISMRDRFTVFYVVLIAALCLTLSDLSYLGGNAAALELFAFIDDPRSPVQHPFLFWLVSWMKPAEGSVLLSKYAELYGLGHWASVKILAYLIIPFIAIAIHPDLRFSNMGLSTRGLSRHLPLYALLFLPVLLLVIAVSFTDSFSSYYPFYRQSTRSAFDFLVWEGLYILQFFALEFFFRGFALQSLRRTMGSAAVWVMLLPYVMIHFGKPFVECIAAVFAGVVLGYLALWTRSIWAGFFIHAGVAIAMDIAANLQSTEGNWLRSIF